MSPAPGWEVSPYGGYRRPQDYLDEWVWDCQMFIYASLLYYEHDLSVWPDETYDNHCHTLLNWYAKLPAWFTERVSEEDLRAGTGFALKTTPAEHTEALAWYSRVRGEPIDPSRPPNAPPDGAGDGDGRPGP